MNDYRMRIVTITPAPIAGLVFIGSFKQLSKQLKEIKATAPKGATALQALKAQTAPYNTGGNNDRKTIS